MLSSQRQYVYAGNMFALLKVNINKSKWHLKTTMVYFWWFILVHSGIM